MIDLEISLAEALHWSLHDIDETDVQSLIAFVSRFPHRKSGSGQKQVKKRVYIDQVQL